jgi:hypothetical protein
MEEVQVDASPVEITRYYKLTDRQEWNGILTLQFHLEDEGFKPPRGAQLVDVDVDTHKHLYLMQGED